MAIQKLAHYSVRTTDLERSCAFYERVLGFRKGFRPPFAFSGAWLYQGSDEREFGVVHLIGTDTASASGLADYLGSRAAQTLGSGTVDHIAFLATDVQRMWATLRSEGIRWRDRTVPSLGLHQVFIEDPSGVTIELNYPAAELEGVALPEQQEDAHTETNA